MAGFRFNSYWKNTTQCFDRITNLTYIQYPNLTKVLANASSDDFTKLNLTTFAITNTSATGLFCNSMLRSATGYWNDTINQYRVQDNPFGIFFLSFLQNLLSNVISISNLYTSISNQISTSN